MKSIRLMMADDHPMIIAGIARSLEDEGCKLVGEAHRADEVIPTFVSVRPDVLVLDIDFGAGKNGLEVGAELIAKRRDARIVFFSQFDTDELIREAYRVGARAFVPKRALQQELLLAIREAARGNVYFPPDIERRMAMLGVHGTEAPQAKLSERELEIFKMMASGLTNTEMAEKVGLSTRQVSTISQTIKDKLGVYKPIELAMLAVKHRLVRP